MRSILIYLIIYQYNEGGNAAHYRSNDIWGRYLAFPVDFRVQYTDLQASLRTAVVHMIRDATSPGPPPNIFGSR